ncbi:MAG TPA: hypothetical protein VG943_01260 [Caulobacterales bacterium]|nr:hypothetical protein [Caulobacterales bacterium]
MDGGQSRTKLEAQSALNAAALDRRLNVRKRAREDGARNLPAIDAQDLSETERAIAAAVAGERTRVEQARAEARADAERRLRALAPVRQDFSGPTLEARLALTQAEGRLAHDWGVVAQRARRSRQDLDDFRQAHDLRRQAVTPASTLWQAGLLFLAALFESLFSATLFAETDPRGLLGGAITAIGLSGANVVLGFLAGYVGLRYLQHRHRFLKAAGGAAFALLFAMALILNGGAAAWRDMLATMQDDSSDATASLWSSVLHLHSPQAVILLMLGAGVWVFATLKGYSKFDDPYPDYGKMDRAARDAEEDLSDFRSEARKELEAPIETARAALSARMEKMRAEHEAMSKAFDAAALKMQTLDARARALDDAAASAVQLYRQENIAARTTPAPAYFSAPPPGEGAARDALAGCAAMMDDARALLEDAQAQTAEAYKGLLAELEGAQARLDAAAR